MKLRIAVLATLVGTSCAGNPTGPRFEAEYSAWALSLKWTNRLEGDRFESLELTLPPNRQGQDLKIDGETVRAVFEHGAPDECPKFHRVVGTVRLIRLNPTDVFARIEAVMQCPDSGDPRILNGEFHFDVKVPR
jgi:hypothetical protein